MNGDSIKKTLRNLGLTNKETEIYIFLAKHGVQKGGEISKRTKTPKSVVYRILKSLQHKGMVESTLEVPTRFAAVPFESVLDLSIRAKHEEAMLIEKAKSDLLADWHNISKGKIEKSPETFVVIEGDRKIFPKLFQMIKETKKELSAISAVPDLFRADRFGVFDAILDHPQKSKVQFRFLTELSASNSQILELIKRRLKVGFDLRGRNPEMGLNLFPRMVIRDNEEILFFITSEEGQTVSIEAETCLCTNCKSIVQAFSIVFEDLWQNSVDIEKKIDEIETGKSPLKTQLIKDSIAAMRIFNEALASARNEVLIVTSPQGLPGLSNDQNMLNNWIRKGVTIKILAPIINENLDSVQTLSKFCEIRHIPQVYQNSTIIDENQLFEFKNSPFIREEINLFSNYANMFYTNESEYAQRARSLFFNIWGNAITASSVPIDSIVINPKREIISVYEDSSAIRNFQKVMNLNIAEKEPCELTEDVVLEKALRENADSAELLKDGVIKAYASVGQAIIRPPKRFHMPKMLITALHLDKRSSLGAEDSILIHLKSETTEGSSFIPTAIVGDNPNASNYWKLLYKNTPAEMNYHLVERNELHIRIHKNKFFVGWVNSIPLPPLSNSLPAACLSLEGYGKVKTGAYSTLFGFTGLRKITEYNALEAFVSFFHPQSKYSGPGTEGLFFREFVETHYVPKRFRTQICDSLPKTIR